MMASTLRATWRPVCHALLLFWAGAISVHAQPLPQQGLYTEILANTRNIDMGTPVWVPVSLDDQLLDPNLSDELTLPYQNLPLFDLSARSSYRTALGIRSVTGLGPINDTLDVFPIRSNAQVRARYVRHYTAHSTDGSPVTGGLLMSASGAMGYQVVDAPGAPYAFERILDALVTLEVVLHRTGMAPDPIWSGVTSIIKSEDVDIPLQFGGELKARHWLEAGDASNRSATLQLLEPFLDVFTVNDDETFAIEYIFTTDTRNYEYPNWISYVEMFSSLDTYLLSMGSEFSFLSTVAPSLFSFYRPINAAVSRVGSTQLAAESNAEEDFRPFSFSPLVSKEFSELQEHPAGQVDVYARDISSINPFGAFGSLGSEARIDVTPASFPAAEPPAEYSAHALPYYSVSYVPGTGGASPSQIDIDMDLVLDGWLEIQARDAAAFSSLASQGLAGARAELYILATITSPRRVETALAFRVLFNGDMTQTVFLGDAVTQLASQFSFSPLPAVGPQTGGRLGIDLDTRLLPANDPLVMALQDIITIAPGDAITVTMHLQSMVFLDADNVQHAERVEVDFYNTMQPILSTDTAGVVLVIADEEGLSEFIFDDGFENP